ncbi:unnamed protein product [Closterium sp. NIES-54]
MGRYGQRHHVRLHSPSPHSLLCVLLCHSPSLRAHESAASAGSARSTEGEGDTEGTQGAESAEEEVEGQLVEEERRRRREAIEASRRLALARQIEQKLAQVGWQIEQKLAQVGWQIEQKLQLIACHCPSYSALRKKGRAEEQLEKLQGVLRPVEVPADSETLTEEERHMFRKLGQKMRAYLEMDIFHAFPCHSPPFHLAHAYTFSPSPLPPCPGRAGKRGVFAGLVENMHLHWKHRELVKIICKERDRRRAEDVAGMLAVESGGVLVDVVAVKKYHAIIVYRGKNYSRPAVLRPKGLLTKRQALKRATEEQRRAVSCDGGEGGDGGDGWGGGGPGGGGVGLVGPWLTRLCCVCLTHKP